MGLGGPRGLGPTVWAASRRTGGHTDEGNDGTADPYVGAYPRVIAGPKRSDHISDGPSGLGTDPSIGPSISVSQGITKGCFCLLHRAWIGHAGQQRLVWADMGAFWVSGVRCPRGLGGVTRVVG